MDSLGLEKLSSQKPAESKTKQATEPGGQEGPGEWPMGGSDLGKAQNHECL